MKYKYLLLMLFVLTNGFVRGQNQNSNLLNDGEFDEAHLRKISISFGYSEEDLDSLMDSQKEQYLSLKKYSNSPFMNTDPTPTPTDPDLPSPYYCNKIDGCSSTPPTYPLQFPTYYDDEFVDNLGDEPDFFENNPAPLARWLGQLGSFNGSWQYDDQYFLDNYSHQIVKGKDMDPLGGFPKVAPGSKYSLRLGGPVSGSKSEKLIRRYTVSSATPGQILTYKYAMVLENPQDHDPFEKPSFRVSLYAVVPTNGSLVEICCERYEATAGENVPGFVEAYPSIYPNVLSKPWTTNVINLSEYYECLTQSSGGLFHGVTDINFVLEFTIKDCTRGAHFGYVYIDGGSLPPKIKKSGRLCKGHELTLSADIIGLLGTETIEWDYGDGTFVQGEVNHITGDYSHIVAPKHVYTAANYPATFICKLTVTRGEGSCAKSIEIERSFTINDCTPVIGSCEECIESFAPVPGEKYILSAWASQVTGTGTGQDKISTYTKPNIQVRLSGPDIILGPFSPTGLVIDGWQKIEAVIDIPLSTTAIEIILNNETVNPTGAVAKVFFDDIRMSPAKANMKTFVYDPITQKLMAELDENNYATFYEYDEEGALIRVKKETARGVSTIKETLSNTHKK